ncbi:MAG TPA: aminotransferase class V-fold PLP-dependent enzyme [Desertimonas sp.]|nr:aminotransferase class V-fold PLP-dependent enzyme [Desertimonas sp.]
MKRNDIVGVDQLVPVLGGRMVCYVNLDNAATTPPLRAVVDAVGQFLPFAASVHRGTGYKSRLSTAAFEDAREAVGHFVGADQERDVVVFTKNTTEAINQLARTLALADDAVVLTTMLEHHSNLLPWRHRATTVCIRARLDGSLDEDDLDAQLARYGNRVALLAVTGASNVTGVVPPIHRLAGKVHAVGGAILVDAAQLAGHRPIDMLAHDDPGHLDVIALSAHKLYAPYGSGALVGDRQLLDVDPEPRGGGTVRAVTRTDVVWADLPDRAEAGSPNLLGAIAFAAATRRLSAVGLSTIADHEQQLATYARTRLAELPEVKVFGASRAELGVISFTVARSDPRLVAAVLGYEHGIGVRSGCFCAQPYVHHLLGLDGVAVERWVGEARRGDLRAAPGLVRISLGCYNDRGDVDRAVEALRCVVTGDIGGTYRQQLDGSFVPIEWDRDSSATAAPTAKRGATSARHRRRRDWHVAAPGRFIPTWRSPL